MQFADDEQERYCREENISTQRNWLRRQQWQHEFVKDLSLIAFYPFETPGIRAKNDAVSKFRLKGRIEGTVGLRTLGGKRCFAV